jgi:hypothetical protein
MAIMIPKVWLEISIVWAERLIMYLSADGSQRPKMDDCLSGLGNVQ